MSRAPKAVKHLTDEHELNKAKEDIHKIIILNKNEGLFAFHLFQNRIQSVVTENSVFSDGSIILGRVEKILNNINGCFVRLTAQKNISTQLQSGYLKYNEDSFELPLALDFQKNKAGHIFEGTLIPVQIKSTAIKSKQISVSTNYELCGRFLVLKTLENNHTYSVTVSNKIDAEIHPEIKKRFDLVLDRLTEFERNFLFNYCNIILRTESIDATEDLIYDELIQLLSIYIEIHKYALSKAPYTVLYDGKGAIHNLILSALKYDTCEIVTDDKEYLNKLQMQFPSASIRLYSDDSITLEQVYSLKSKVSDLLNAKVFLKSGAFLVIEPTEALTVVDVNSGKANNTKLLSDEYILSLNTDALFETLYQIKARNISGIIIVDFINFKNKEYQKRFISIIKEETKKQDESLQFYDYTRLGLAEFTRRKSGAPVSTILNKF